MGFLIDERGSSLCLNAQTGSAGQEKRDRQRLHHPFHQHHVLKNSQGSSPSGNPGVVTDLETEFVMKSVLQGFALLFNFKVIVIIMLSSIYGLFVGAMPGLTATMAAALLIPFTFFMDPVPALVSVVTMSAMAIFAGDIPAALIRIPGTPSSAAYTQDSFELTKQGKAELVLGADVFFSASGVCWGQSFS